MGELFQPMHLIIIAVIVIFLFGGRKLPELGKGLGEGLRWWIRLPLLAPKTAGWTCARYHPQFP